MKKGILFSDTAHGMDRFHEGGDANEEERAEGKSNGGMGGRTSLPCVMPQNEHKEQIIP